MARFLIEVPHTDEECALAIQTFLKTGSHYMTNAEWGCSDLEHKGWIIVEVDSKDEARRVLPPAFRSQAKIVTLRKFTIEEIDEVLSSHGG
jgi:hypothetical protein